MTQDIGPFELSSLARTMTLKYAFLDIPFGGAKAAILADAENVSAEEKDFLVRRFARKLAPLRRRYLPGQDIGIDGESHRVLLETMGLEAETGRTDSAFFTAATTILCLDELLRRRGMNWDGFRILIEGFGKVGGWVGRLAVRRGARVVAVSTSCGGLYDPAGLDVEKILALRDREGSGFPFAYPGGRNLSVEELCSLEADAFVPCAGSWSVCLANAGRLRAPMVVCGANNAVTDAAKPVLAERGIQYFPDFVSNGGGVLGAMMESLLGSRTEALRFVERFVGAKVRRLMDATASGGGSPAEAAEKTALRNLAARDAWERSAAGRLFSFALMVYKRKRVPVWLCRLAGPLYLRHVLRRGA